ncbi:alpha/beta fold hydrolase [Mycobacteroides chelonae]|uniref:Hydrolase n=1 Tax=Mycobacteroides chelonae TaxID=1774 RepID=A0AB73M9N7_MYCCH|nr:alpha/beta hydrolase [Mycobacteroides chelonae]MBF9325687.1 alpha/beta hydrolase [Mycobacteroides chelonae]MBF9419863.1 alpha/beta hydrolase [Mycobacteroides chelonae]MBF9438346.1 alpha/beta hydrolase [Mycobacteroides chelonae]MBV6359647.1 alpha/beta hydrolase [Mycobacteroides chelonae]MEC4834712.1 alpha/beta hydrolase [Mycobacteroides chelonae]
MTVSQITHRQLSVNGIDMHVAEQGEGPAVVLCHGFPGLWYTWRHQLAALSAAGYRAIAPDMRGYGRTTAPRDVTAYNRSTTVNDLVGLLDALDLHDAVFSGHDFGAHLVWDMPAWAGDRVRALIQLSVPRTRRLPVTPSVGFNYLASQHFTHLEYFQEPGVAESELDAQPKTFLATLFHALSGANRYLDCWDHPAHVGDKRNGYLDVLPSPPPLPWNWLSEQDLDYYAAEFTRTGFTGGLNWYRAEDLVWSQNEHLHDRPIGVPVTFIAGSADPVLEMLGRDPMTAMADLVPGLRSVLIVEGAGHFVQMERPDAVNTAMIEFLGSLPPR